MVAVVGIISGHDLSIHTCHENESKLVLYKPLLHCNSHFKQQLSNKMEHFNFEGGHG